MYKEIQILQYHGTIILQELLRQTSTIHISLLKICLLVTSLKQWHLHVHVTAFIIERGLGRVSIQGITA